MRPENSHIKLYDSDISPLSTIKKKSLGVTDRSLTDHETSAWSVHPNSAAFDSASLTTTGGPWQPLAFF